jgi:hypothetical protein
MPEHQILGHGEPNAAEFRRHVVEASDRDTRHMVELMRLAKIVTNPVPRAPDPPRNGIEIRAEALPLHRNPRHVVDRISLPRPGDEQLRADLAPGFLQVDSRWFVHRDRLHQLKIVQIPTRAPPPA